jgi:hypothetical protein
MPDLSKFEHVKHDKLRRLLAYWLDLRGDKLVPRRAQLDPIAIPWALSHIWLLQLDLTVDRFRYRLAGESVQGIYEQNISGKTIFDLMDEDNAGIVDAKFHQICHEPCICHDIGPVYTKTDRPGLGERVILPLATDEGQNEFILGCTIYDWRGYLDPSKDPAIAYTTTFVPIT